MLKHRENIKRWEKCILSQQHRNSSLTSKRTSLKRKNKDFDSLTRRIQYELIQETSDNVSINKTQIQR